MSWHVLFVCMGILTALKAWLVCKLVGNHFWIWGAAACIVLILELRLVCLPVFGFVDRFRDVSVWTTDTGRWEVFIFIVVYQLCLEG